MVDFDKEANVEVLPPHCRIHTVWEDKERAEAHAKMYRESGLIPRMVPLADLGGPAEELEPWMKYGE